MASVIVCYEDSQKKYECKECGTKFRDSYNLNRHFRVHDPNKKPKPKVNCVICKECFRRQDIITHYTEHHKVKIESEALLFTSSEHFSNWKAYIESATNTKYVKTRAGRSNMKGGSKEDFYCHRDGYYKCKGRNIRKLKNNGSNKLNGHCPSKLSVDRSPNDEVYVHFTKTHLGHELITDDTNTNPLEGELLEITVDEKPGQEILPSEPNSPDIGIEAKEECSTSNAEDDIEGDLESEKIQTLQRLQKLIKIIEASDSLETVFMVNDQLSLCENMVENS